MRALPHHRQVSRHFGPRAVAAIVAAVAVLLALAVSPPSSAAGGARPGARLPAAEPERPPSDTSAPAPGTYRVTLLTGDVVVLHVAADGRQAASLEDAPADGSGRDPQIFERDGHVHVVPAEVSEYLAAGVVDERLFDVTALVRQGLHDAAAPKLPLVVSVPEGVTTFSAPSGAEVGRRLGSIGAVSMTAAKDAVRSVWESLRGASPLADDATPRATLAGANSVWLDGVVHAALDESVAQVGAPAAWAEGLDGSGVSVAVLDSGYDPSHPDLQDRVVASANFSAEKSAVDGNGHGTHVAATVAGSGAASDGTYRGVAPGSKLLIGKVLDDSGSGFESEIIAGMQWAVDQGADVVNLSLGTDFASDGSDPLSLAVNQLTESSDALFVVAAGNTGPAPSTVTSPGAADAALTVGAVDKADQAAWFSSRGPRFGDGAIKPEIVAPGVGIVAARAAGTSLGNLLDEHYTALNGTSMATPHVAGAAAILAQQHPDWGAEELKGRLVSAATPLDNEPVTFQGAGRLDVAAAVGDTVGVDHGVLYLGSVDHDAEAVTAELTYHNPTDQRVTLRLSADVDHTGPGGARRPALRLSRSALSIPAGGEATTTVLLTPNRAEAGTYEGHITAVDVRGRQTPVHTATSFSIVPPSHTVTLEAIDRHGGPATGPVDLLNIDTWEEHRTFLLDGSGTVDLPAGDYTVVAAIETAGDGTHPASVTVTGDTQVTVEGDVHLSYDARGGEQLAVDTPRPAQLDNVHVIWRRSIGDAAMTSLLWSARTGEKIYTIPGDPAETGDFDLWTTWQLAEPLLTLDLFDDPDMLPQLASMDHPYVGNGELPVVDVGTGTPEEFAAADVEGKIAVATRPDGDVSEQAVAAEAAGAEFLLVINNRPGPWATSIWPEEFPTYTMQQRAGKILRDAIAADPDPRLDVDAIHDSTYAYELVFTEAGGIPSGTTYDVADEPLATVRSDYRDDSPDQGRRESWIPFVDGVVLGTALGSVRNGPVERTEYVSTDGVEWQRFGQPHGEFLNMYWTETAIETYVPGQTYDQVWWGPLVAPGVPVTNGLDELGSPLARFRDVIRVLMPHYRYGAGTLAGTIQEQLGDTSELTLRRDGEVVGTSTWPEAQFTVAPEAAEYELNLRVDSGSGTWRSTSVATETTWRFTSQRPDEERVVLPLVQATYELAAGERNQMPVGSPYPLIVRPEYQPGAAGPGGFDVTVEVSFDDGASWTATAVEADGDDRFEATVPATAEAGFATVRVTVTDDDGNAMTQRIDRAWRVG
ncbi:S8 family serine peptidase [Haloactinopolyspora sp.]|uniref:S8 family serine peptidase n=1 Tax=Haloactinopolyspora sp. TaxID=1966353 RepID=UPI00260D19A8|nr:S8 family serine peptidase [Haloactinopolyspora sp.]